MVTFYGSDTYCLTDLPLIDLQVTNPKILIGQRVARRLQTPRGALASINDDPDFGWDVRQYCNGKIGPNQIGIAKSQIESECLKDEQVATADAAITFDGGDLTIDIEMDTSAGPFLLTLNVSALTVEAVFDFGIDSE